MRGYGYDLGPGWDWDWFPPPKYRRENAVEKARENSPSVVIGEIRTTLAVSLGVAFAICLALIVFGIG